jgi:prepilin-type N-terminal cleavage/methylation domain-containing protein
VSLPKFLLRLRDDERGYSLMELLTSIVIMTIVLTGLTTVFVSGSQAEYDLNARFQAQQQTRLALDRLRRDIHQGGCVNPTIPADGSTLLLSRTVTTTCTAFAYYCSATSPTLSTKSALYYWWYDGTVSQNWTTAPTLPVTCSQGRLVADDLIPYAAGGPTLFGPAPFSTASAGLLQKVSIDLRVDASDKKTGGLYRLQDDIVLRNSTRTP